MKNTASSLSKTAIILGLALQIAQGMDQAPASNPGNNYSRSATAADFNHDGWRTYMTGIDSVDLQGEGIYDIKFKIKVIPSGPELQMLALKPTCSILMNNGGQIDYIPGVAALWICRDQTRSHCIVTGNFRGKDLFSYSTEDFANILINTPYINASQPVHVTFSETGEFPIKHPADIHNQVIQNWLS